jgi:outer membrane immunogenic protein
MRCRFLCAGFLASVAAGAGSAVAADYPVRPLPAPAAAAAAPIAVAPVYVPDWVGFYVGIHGGGGTAHTSFDQGFFDSVDTFFVPPSASPSGGLGGGQAGYNWQWGQVVGGLEVDFSAADLHETTTFFVPPVFGPFPLSRDVKIDRLASTRARLGYLVWPNLLLFGTAGIGYGHTRFTTTFTQPTFVETNTSDVNEFGWVAGAGLEWKFWDHWLLRGEWLHYDFGRVATGFDEVLNVNVNARTTVDVGRAALSYKF